MTPESLVPVAADRRLVAGRKTIIKSVAGRKTIIKSAVLAAAILFLLVEQIFFFHDSGSAAPAPSSTGTAQTRTVQDQVSAALQRALGPSDRNVQRFAVAARAVERRTGALRLTVRWAINGELSLGSVSAWAQYEVYEMLRQLFTDPRLRLTHVELIGTFGDKDASGRAREVRVLEVGLDIRTAKLLDWENLDANTVWPLLEHPYMRAGFECQCQE